MVHEHTQREQVKEWRATGPASCHDMETVIGNHYRTHYGRVVPPLLNALDLRSNNTRDELAPRPDTAEEDADAAVLCKRNSTF